MRHSYLPAILAVCLATAASASPQQTPETTSTRPLTEIEALTSRIRTAMATAVEASEGLVPSQIELAVSQSVEDVIGSSGADSQVVQSALRLAVARENCVLRDNQTWSHVGCAGLNRVAEAVGLALQGPAAFGGRGGVAAPGLPPPASGNGRGSDYRPGN